MTGAGRGIGAGIARRLHAAGARIAVFDRDQALAHAVAQELEGLPLVGDVCSQAHVEGAVEIWLSGRWGRCRSWSTMPASPAAPI